MVARQRRGADCPGESNVGIAFFYAIPVGMIEPVHQFGVALSLRMLAYRRCRPGSVAARAPGLLEHSAEELEAIRAALAPAAQWRALFERPESEQELVSAVCLRSNDKRLFWAIAGHPPPLRLPGLDSAVAGRLGLLARSGSGPGPRAVDEAAGGGDRQPGRASDSRLG